MTGTPTLDLGEAAQDYRARGWPVHPLHSWTGDRCSCGRPDCTSPAKHPRLRHGLNEATTDADVIRDWWEREPQANIGLATGVAFDVLDIDGPVDGTTELARLVAEHGDIALEGPTAATGNGYHLLVQSTGHGNRAKFLTGCDWRGRGGYIVAPPSVHPSGWRYCWLENGPDTPIQPAPDWLVALLDPPKSGLEAGHQLATLPDRRSRSLTAYCQRALESECGRIALADEGHRNDQLNVSAYNLGRLIGPDLLSAEEVVGSLLTAALRAGLDWREAVATIQSGIRAGIQQPRRLPA
jgi:hypothetical protein